MISYSLEQNIIFKRVIFIAYDMLSLFMILTRVYFYK